MTEQPPLTLPARRRDAHKGDYGRVLLVGGSRGMSGSIALSSIAALHTGSGLVTAAVPDRCLETVAGFHPAIMTYPLCDQGSGRFSIEAAGELAQPLDLADAIGCGPGMTTEPGSIRIVERILQSAGRPRVLDADAINVMSQIEWSNLLAGGPLVLTPHPGEFARLSGVESKHRSLQVEAAQGLAQRHSMVIVLKGGPTIVVSADQTWTNSTGNPGMATAGSGDVLTGVITSLLGQGLCDWDAARLGVWIHGRAGDLVAAAVGQAGLTAPAISSAIPQVVDEVTQ